MKQLKLIQLYNKYLTGIIEDDPKYLKVKDELEEYLHLNMDTSALLKIILTFDKEGLEVFEEVCYDSVETYLQYMVERDYGGEEDA